MTTLGKVLVVGLCLGGMTALAQESDNTPCLRVKGIVVDYATHRPLSDAKLYAKLPTGRIKISISSESGKFFAKSPCEATAILIERTGYRSQILSLQKSKILADTQAVVISIPLIAIERQSNDKTYLQTEQTDYVQQSSALKFNKTDSSAVQHGLFMIKDALRNTPLQAKACFFFTKNGGKKCLNSDSRGLFKLDFTQTDIVAVEVTSAGYQTYAGNLIVEALDGRSLPHEIRLQRDLTVLAIRADGATRCELRTKNKVLALVSLSGHSGWFNKYDLLSGQYELVVTRQKRITRQPIQLSNGLNYKILPAAQTNNIPLSSVEASPRKSAIVTGPAAPILSLPDTIPMIYFEQGSYQLRADSQEVLRTVASYLKNHRNYLIQVAGHTDNVGDERLNKSLSDFRASVTANFLVRQGIAEGKLTKIGHGSRYPISPNDIEANKALNRRVSLKLIAIQ